jgi:chromosome segregation protein
LLKLKRVEIHGFKSFYDRTEMKFNGSGIAAVVGPNGCGKSNLSDAISWVLGEQSAKSLRGARMEDVIFAGTRDKKALGMASVTMTLVPDEAKLGLSLKPPAHTEGSETSVRESDTAASTEDALATACCRTRSP